MLMKYKITHKTMYEYVEAVPVCQNVVRLTPRNDGRQKCTYHRLIVRPIPAHVSRRTDYFGNTVQDFSIHEGHRALRVTAMSNVEVRPVSFPDASTTTAWEAIRDATAAARTPVVVDACQFRFGSSLVTGAAELADYARQSFTPERPVLEAVVDLNGRIHTDFTYDPTATDIQTPWQEVFRNRRGVCQDLAHVTIGCLRSLGLAARYVSGYLRTIPPPGRRRLVGADASHAWVSLYCGELDWDDLDPRNNLLPSDEPITLAWGRDYADVAPIRGMFVGGGSHQLSVSVDVVPLDAASTEPTTGQV